MTATAQYPQNISFEQFRDAVRAQFAVLQTLGELYTVDLPKDELYQFYLDSLCTDIRKRRRKKAHSFFCLFFQIKSQLRCKSDSS